MQVDRWIIELDQGGKSVVEVIRVGDCFLTDGMGEDGGFGGVSGLYNNVERFTIVFRNCIILVEDLRERVGRRHERFFGRVSGLLVLIG